MDKSARDADVMYKAFSLEYSDSSSRQDFQERVRQRLSKESFKMQASEARALSRVYVSDEQVKAWSDCMKSGGVLLVASYSNQTAFPLKVSWSPPRRGWPRQHGDSVAGWAYRKEIEDLR